jgi:sulfite exporter TauE/SafE
MLTGLLITAFLMGLSGIPHCTAMCGAACAVAFPGGLSLATWVGRLLGYALLGAVAALSAGTVSRWGSEVAMLKPVWVMAQVVVVMLGVHLVVRGRVPAFLEGAGQGAYHRLRRWALAHRPTLPRSSWGFLGGLSWAVLPCGLLYAALMLSALAPDAWGGAAVMLAFGVPSSVGVWSAPWVLRKLSAWRPGRWAARQAPSARPVVSTALGPSATVPMIWLQLAPGGPQPDPLVRAGGATSDASAVGESGTLVDPRWAVRLSGLGLAVLGSWAVWHQLVAQWQAWCA